MSCGKDEFMRAITITKIAALCLLGGLTARIASAKAKVVTVEDCEAARTRTLTAEVANAVPRAVEASLAAGRIGRSLPGLFL